MTALSYQGACTFIKAIWSARLSRAAFGVSPKARSLFGVAAIVFAMCVPALGQKANDSAANDKLIREGWEQERKEAQAAHAKVFKEPLMVRIDPAMPTVRFVCIRTFHRPFCIRVFRDASGPKLRVVRFAGKGGYEWGEPDLDETRRITEDEWQKVLQAAKTPDVHSPLRNMTPAEDVFFYGLDGSTWFLETNLQPKATFVRVWTPTAFVGKEAQEKPASVNLQPLCDFGMMLIKLAGLPSNDPEDRIY